MFYSQFILAKKGPLGTIWIAAHLERKLRKNQVADTDIGVSVDSILFPDAPIALRLSSHLLLGVVRIYSKKVNYLFDDCSEALLKIKQAFRSTAVDLPPEESTAPYHSITLPETFDLDDFEIPDTDILRGNFVDHHVSTKEQITLQETIDGAVFSTSKFGLDERFGDGDTSHVSLDFEEDLLLGKIGSQFDEIADINSTVSNTSGVFVGSSTLNEIDAPDFEAQAPSTPGLVSEPNIVTVLKSCDATSEDNNDIMEENEEAVETMNVDTDVKLPEESECVLRPCTSVRTENEPVLESVSYPESEPLKSASEGEVDVVISPSDPEAEPVKTRSESEDEPVKPLSGSEVELGKSYSEPEVEPVNPLSSHEFEPVKLDLEPQVNQEAEPVQSHSEPEFEPAKILSDMDSDPETEPIKFRTDPEDSRMESSNIISDLGDSPVEPLSLVSKTTPVTVSGRSKTAKRKFLERLDSAESERTLFKDDDLLSTILGGRRSSLASNPSAIQEMSSRKRAKTTPRVTTAKRKVLVDDSMGLLGDTIRKQLANTADIRRLRKKAPCTLAEIASVQRLLIDDGIFVEAVLSGMASDLRRLHFGKLDLSAIRMEDTRRDEVQAPDPDDNQERKDDQISGDEVAYHGDKCAGDAILDGSDQTRECSAGKSDNPENSGAIPLLDECEVAGDLDSCAKEIPEFGGEERASTDEPNEESTVPEPEKVEEIGDALDEAGCASITDDVAEQNNGEILEDNFVGNNTEFLTIDDDDEDIAEGDADDGQPLDNSGWSSRTRAVANYLQQLFNKETKYERSALSVNTLLTGKTSKEASRMFFETLVLKTKDYIQVEQGKPYEHISIKPRVRLMKSEF